MRLWSLHPKYLDPACLVALWREGLLAKNVLQGRTRGYRHHPQLDRFRSQRHPGACISSYLYGVWLEAKRRGYSFDGRKIGTLTSVRRISVTKGQLEYELKHLLRKLTLRKRSYRRTIAAVVSPSPHPLFRVVKGRIEPWERL